MGRKNKRGASREMAKGRTPSCFSCTTFNILAPIYKRLDHQDQSRRESDYKADWINRNHMILDSLLAERSSIICLQEFWVGNEDLVNMYNERLGDAGYVNYKLARTNNRGDGILLDVKDANWMSILWMTDMFLQVGEPSLLTAVHKDYFRVIDDQQQEILLNGFGDRVAQLLHVELLKPFLQHRMNNCRQEMLIVNTHLLFPHDSSLCLERLRQVYKILQYVESYQKEKKLTPLPILLCGDWNGSKRGHVYKFLRSQGFVSSYDTAHQYSDTDVHKWVSHRNHRGNICGVDFIWLLNPNRYRKALKTSLSETVFGMCKDPLWQKTLTASCASTSFWDASLELNITGNCFGLSMNGRKDLRELADIDGNGPTHFKELLQRIRNPTLSDQRDEVNNEVWEDEATEHTFGISVNDAVLFPTEVEKGIWPEDYCLSDHARLTAVFSPIKMSRPRLLSS